MYLRSEDGSSARPAARSRWPGDPAELRVGIASRAEMEQGLPGDAYRGQ